MANKANLSKPYHVRLPVEQAQRFEQLASTANVNMSVFLRAILTDKKHISIKQLDKEDEHRRAHVLRVVSKSGNNLNQIAHSLNTLNLKGELDHDHAMKYLSILEDIQIKLQAMLNIYDN